MIDAERLTELVGKFPVPAATDGKLAEVDKAATDAAVAELLKAGREAVVGLVGRLAPTEKGGDSRARHALHAVVIHAGDHRRMVAEALASTLADDRPADVRVFVLRQLQLVGGKEVVGPVGKLLTDEAVGEAAAETLVALRAAEPLRSALPRSTGRRRLAIVHALGRLRDPDAAPALRPLLADKDRDTRLTAAWALAGAGDADSAEPLLKAAAAATGYDRAKLTQACLLLAETLQAAGRPEKAVAIYTDLRDSRTDPSERYVRDAAVRGLAAKK